MIAQGTQDVARTLYLWPLKSRRFSEQKAAKTARAAFLEGIVEQLGLSFHELSDCKKCTKCGKVKPLSEFHKNSCRKDGHRARCKECEIVYAKAYREANRENMAAKRREFYRLNPGKHYDAAYQRQYREAHKAKNKAYQKQWYLDNKEAVCERARLYNEVNQEKIRCLE